MAGLFSTYIPRTSIGAAARVGLFLNDRNILEGSIGAITYDEGFSESRLNIHEYNFSLRLKHFLLNSLHIDPGLALKQYSSTFDYRYKKTNDSSFPSYITTNDRYIKYDVTTLGPTFALGNHWQWSHFTIGADWIEAYYPLLHERKTGTIGATADGDDIDTASHYENTRMNALDLSIRFYLGAAF